MALEFAELLARSNFSFLEGASHPNELYQRARELKLSAIALTDRDGFYGSARMHLAARETTDAETLAAEQNSPRLIVGVEVSVLPRHDDYKQRRHASVALLAENARGYSALCRLLTSAHANYPKGEAWIDVQSIANDCEDLFAIVPVDQRFPLSDRDLTVLREGFSVERCAIATWRHLDAYDRPRLTAAGEASARFDMPIVASARPLYHHRSRKPLCDVVHCIRLGTTLQRAGTALTPNAEAELKSARAMQRMFPDNPEWLTRSMTIAERCHFSLEELDYSFPTQYGDERLDPNEQLRLEVERGKRDRYPNGVPDKVAQLLAKELSLIAKLDVAPYFLSVLEVVRIARKRQILCQGRGSAANSAVCFVLGVTAVDPARSSLLFERFMSEERREPPDIDVDFEHERREEVIQEIYRLYGRDRAAMVSEVICYRGKSAMREVGKVFSLSSDQLDRLSSIASHWTARADADGSALAKRGLDPNSAQLRKVVELAGELSGFPRHLSIHVGGFVLSSEPLNLVAPIEPASMEDRTVIPWDKDDLDALGFFKIDVLGLGMLTAVRKALAAIHVRAGGKLDQFDPIGALARVPPEDPVVYDMICKADTVGVFQIESRAQMAMLPLLKPRKFYDLVVEVGIVRPGPIQGKMVHPYLARRTGEQEVSYPHECLKPILERTLGVPLFQEQVMQIAIVGAGYTGGEADQLRRDMAAWRKNGRLARHEKRLLDGFRKRGIPDEFGRRLYQQIMGFGEYGFPESHSSSFALIVYVSCWLKRHHPAAFACALINSQPMGFYSPASIVRDAQRHGVLVRPVCLVESDWDCTLEPSEPSVEEQALRLGFRLVSGLGQETVQRLEQARAERPFADIHDVVARTGLKRNEMDALAEAGAFDRFIGQRREAMWQARAPRERALFKEHALEPSKRQVGLPGMTAQEQLSLDYSAVGISLHDHPMRHVRPNLRRRRVLFASEQQTWRQGQRVTVAGVVLTRQRPMTASGIVFVTLEDETGVLNLVLYNSVFDRYELVARHAGMMLARGIVDRRGDVVHVRARHLERLDMPRGQPLTMRSRDFH